MSQAETASVRLESGWLSRWWPELAVGALWLGWLIFLFDTRYSQDIAWQLWIGRQMLFGTDLYGHIAEVNPPLWYWMAMPIEALAPLLGLLPVRLLTLALFALVGVSLAMSAALVRHWLSWQRAALLVGMMVALIGMFMQELEQREHLCLIGALPYALLVARRVRGLPVDWRLALAIGLFAAPFVALKHYFVLIPILLEIWLLVARKRGWRPFRPETLALVGIALLYAAAVVAFEWDYLTFMVPRLSLAYGDLRSPLFDIAVNRGTLTLYMLAPYLWFVRKELAPEAKAMLLIAAGFLGSYLIQFKGWQYHISPVTSALVLGVILHLAIRPRQRELSLPVFGFAVALLVIVAASGVLSGRYESGWDRHADQLLADLEPGDTVMLLSTKPYYVWPMVEERGLRWPSRYFHYWMMQTVAHLDATGQALPPKLAELITAVQNETVTDLACNPPDRIIDDTSSVVGERFDLLGLLKEEPRFATLFAAYEKSEGLGPFDLYQRVGPIPAEFATDCVAVH